MTVYAVIDFETTGLSAAQGARPTEVGLCLLEGDVIVDRYQSLMNPGCAIPSDITRLTGISNAMVRAAPDIAVVMNEAANFVGDRPLLAHNAAFDRTFWHSELTRIGRNPRSDFACSLLLSRRLFPHCVNHRLATLVSELELPAVGAFHRALADAEYTAALLVRIKQELQDCYNLPSIEHRMLMAIQTASKKDLSKCIGTLTGVT